MTNGSYLNIEVVIMNSPDKVEAVSRQVLEIQLWVGFIRAYIIYIKYKHQ
jgi:hypothetical protein